MRRIFGLAPNVFFLGLVSLFNDFSAEMIYAVMPAFLTTVLGAPPVFLGFLEGFAEALASVLKIFSGWVSDRLKKRKIVALIGYTISVGIRWGLAFVMQLWQVFFLRTIDRIGKGTRDSARDALLGESVEKQELGKSFGYHRMMDTIGATLGPLSAVLILPMLANVRILSNDYQELFLVAFGLGLLAIFAFMFVHEPRRDLVIPSEPPRFSFSLKKYSRDFKFFILAVFIFGLGVMPLILVLLKTTAIGFGATMIPAMYLVYNISFVLFAIPFGRLSDRIGQKKVLIGGFLVAIIAYLIFAVTSNFAWLVVGFIIFGFYSAMTDGVQRALASKLVPPEKLASAQGFLSASVGISSLLSGVIGGSIWTFVGYQAAFVYGAAFMTIGLILFLRVSKHINTHIEPGVSS